MTQHHLDLNILEFKSIAKNADYNFYYIIAEKDVSYAKIKACHTKNCFYISSSFPLLKIANQIHSITAQGCTKNHLCGNIYSFSPSTLEPKKSTSSTCPVSSPLMEAINNKPKEAHVSTENLRDYLLFYQMLITDKIPAAIQSSYLDEYLPSIIATQKQLIDSLQIANRRENFEILLHTLFFTFSQRIHFYIKSTPSNLLQSDKPYIYFWGQTHAHPNLAKNSHTIHIWNQILKNQAEGLVDLYKRYKTNKKLIIVSEDIFHNQHRLRIPASEIKYLKELFKKLTHTEFSDTEKLLASLSDEQKEKLMKSGFVKVLYSLFKDDGFHLAGSSSFDHIDKVIANYLNQLKYREKTQEEEKFLSYYNYFIYTARENLVINEINYLRKKFPNHDIYLVYGKAHQFLDLQNQQDFNFISLVSSSSRVENSFPYDEDDIQSFKEKLIELPSFQDFKKQHVKSGTTAKFESEKNQKNESTTLAWIPYNIWSKDLLHSDFTCHAE